MKPTDARAILDDYLASLRSGNYPRTLSHPSTSFSLDTVRLNA